MDTTAPDGTAVYPTIAAAIRRFTETREGSPRTAQTYAHCLGVFTRFLAEAYGLAADASGTEALTIEMPAEFYSWLARRTTKHGTTHRPLTARLYTAAVRALFLELALLDVVPAVDIPRLLDLLKKRLPRDVYPHVDPSPLIPTIVGYFDRQPEPAMTQARLVLLRNRALLHTLYSTAMRVSEAASLRRGQVAGVVDECTITGKGGTVRRVFLTAPARAALATYLAARSDHNPYLFISHGRGPGRAAVAVGAGAGPRWQPLTTVRLWSVVHEAALACGAPDVHPHVLRHYRASRWLTDGMPLEMVQELLGHREIGVTRKVYAHYLGSAVKEAFFRYDAPLPSTPSP